MSSATRVACVLAGVVVLGWAAPAPAPAAALGDPYLPRQWGLAQIGAPAAWARSTGAGVAIGIVDSGVDLDHEDLAGKVVADTSCIGPGSENFAALDALVVGATDPLGNVASYSNPLTTAKWGLVAPGGAGTGDERDVLSTWWDAANPASTGTYTYRAGPSMAVPHVSGAVALLLAQGL